ncbi:hypothetical protein GVAV_002532 [Gurleya vavrai]
MKNPYKTRVFERNQLIEKSFYKRAKKIPKISRYRFNDKVRIAQHDNISKDLKGRFLRTGTIKGVLGSDSYLVQYDDNGMLTRKRGFCLKKATAWRGDVTHHHGQHSKG